MRTIATMTIALVVGIFAVALARLSPDAIGLAVGVVFGVAAGLPVALLMLANQRRTPTVHDAPPPSHQPQPPIIVITGGQLAQPPDGYEPHRSSSHGYAPALPDLRRQIPAQPAAVARWADVEDWQ